MATLTVGTTGQQYATIDAAVDASSAGDAIAVQAGTYTNDWLNITHDLTLQAIGGMVVMTTANDAHPPNGKAMITETGNVTISDEVVNLGALPLADGRVTFALAPLSAGDHRLLITFSGDADFESSGATVILGCFILFGAASIVAGIQSTASLGQ